MSISGSRGVSTRRKISPSAATAHNVGLELHERCHEPSHAVVADEQNPLRHCKPHSETRPRPLGQVPQPRRRHARRGRDPGTTGSAPRRVPQTAPTTRSAPLSQTARPYVSRRMPVANTQQRGLTACPRGSSGGCRLSACVLRVVFGRRRPRAALLPACCSGAFSGATDGWAGTAFTEQN